MDPVKTNLRIGTLTAAITFEILFLCSCAIRETMMLLQETVLKIILRINSRYHFQLPLDVRKVSKYLSHQGIF
jgi:hypothetical protein